MSNIKRFEDLIAWQKARILTQEVYLITREMAFSKDFGLCNQIQRAAVSIMSNIAEGFERGGTIEFRRFLDIAKGSCGEVRTQLYVAHERGYLDQEKFQKLLLLAEEVSRIIKGLHSSLK